MTIRKVKQKLVAWQAGRPIPRYDTIHHAIVVPEQALIVAFVRMAGESRPWGIAWGVVGAEPKIRCVPDGRVRDDVAVLCADFAEDLLQHMRVHNWTYDPVDHTADPSELRQVWFPNGQHVAMLHHLNYTYSQTKFGGANQEILRALGRLAGWMFRDTSRTGSQHVVNASAALNDAYTFPAQDVRTAHLGYQLGWLVCDGSRAERMTAATLAESSPVSPTMSPELDREQLAELVEQWQKARSTGVADTESSVRIHELLEAELGRRWLLTEEAYRVLSTEGRRVNEGVQYLVRQAHEEFWYQHQRIELRLYDSTQGPAFVAHPETDYHGSAAASRYLIHAADDEAYASCLIHDDPTMLQESIDAGDAVRATVSRVYDTGTDRKRLPHWEIQIDADPPNRLRENSRLTPHGSPGHEATIISIDFDDRGLILTIEWTARKTRLLNCGIGTTPLDPAWVGQTVDFVISDAADLTRRRSQRVWSAKDGAGAWLTHGKPPVQIEITSDDEGDADLLVDDVRQLEEGASA